MILQKVSVAHGYLASIDKVLAINDCRSGQV